MKTTISISVILTQIVLLMLVISCSTGNTVVNPGNDSQQVPGSFGVSESGRNIVAIYDAVIDPDNGTFTITPIQRSASYHFPLTQLYPNVLKIVGYGWTPNFWADIKLSHPFPGSGIDGFDARVIAIIPANSGVSFYYPSFNVMGNHAALLDHDGWTFLYDELGGSIPGNINPFVCYFRAEPHRVWSSTGITSETQRWNINLAGFGGQIKYKLVVDVSSNYPASPQPVVDNTKESFIVSDPSITGELNPFGGQAHMEITLLDWQGLPGIGCQVEADELFNGLRQLHPAYTGPLPDTYVFSCELTNDLMAPEGVYPMLIGVWDRTTNIYNYAEFQVAVGPAPGGHVRPIKFFPKPAEDTWFDICVQPDGPVYVVADHPATGNVGGNGEDGKRTALRFINDLSVMDVINPGTGMASPNPDSWEFGSLEFHRIDVSTGGYVITDVGGIALVTWAINDNIATYQACCWQYVCGGDTMSIIADVSEHLYPPIYGTGLFGLGHIHPDCPQGDWTITFSESDMTWSSGQTLSSGYLFDDVLSIAGIEGIPGTLNMLVFYSSSTEGKLYRVGDIYGEVYPMDIIEWTGTYGQGPGQFMGGLDVALDSNSNSLTLEDHGGGVFRFQKFQPNFDQIYESVWEGSGNPMRMDYDTSDNTLYLLCDNGVYICAVD